MAEIVLQFERLCSQLRSQHICNSTKGCGCKTECQALGCRLLVKLGAFRNLWHGACSEARGFQLIHIAVMCTLSRFHNGNTYFFTRIFLSVVAVISDRLKTTAKIKISMAFRLSICSRTRLWTPGILSTHSTGYLGPDHTLTAFVLVYMCGVKVLAGCTLNLDYHEAVRTEYN